MGKAPRRRQRTGCLRRGPKRNHSSYRRSMHLSHAEVGYLHLLQSSMLDHGTAARSALLSLSPLLLLSIVVSTHHVIAATAPNAAIAIGVLLRLVHLKYAVNQTRFVREFLLDHRYFDIPLQEEWNHHATRLPRQEIRFNSWTDQECYDFTSFKKDQLRRIYAHFGLAQLAAQNSGFVRVSNGHAAFHRFHPEEIFLFMMTKCKTGFTNKEMCDLIFGGHASRWSFGWPWILRYVDARYQDILGHQGLVRYVNDFPRYFDAIQNHIKKSTVHHATDFTAEVHTGLQFLPFSIFGFIDCSIDRINRPFSGPDGDYIGAPRREEYYDAQRSVYTGYKKCHGIKVETVMLPNGLSFVYGPCSARPNDVQGILQMSGLDQFLLQLQQGRPHIYSAFGDGVYGAQGLQCVRSYFRAYGPGAQLTQAQRLCNRKIKPCRQAIEWSYADVENIFKICSNPANYRLGKRLPYAQQQLRVCHLLSNIYVCLNGSKTSSYRKFRCPPPELDDYLRL